MTASRETMMRNFALILANGFVAFTLLFMIFPGQVQAQSGPPVKIGVLTDQSGAAADYSGKGSVISARMAVEDFGGSVLGRPIELLAADHLSKLDVGLGIARRWYDDDVHAIFDVGLTSIAIGVQKLAQEKNQTVIFVSSGSTDLTGKYCSPNGIHWTYDTYSQARGAFLAYKDDAKKSWYFLTVDYAYGTNIQRDIAEMVTASGGTVIGTTKHPFETSDFGSDLLTAQASNAAIIGLATTTMHAVTAAKQAQDFGMRDGGQRIATPSITLHDVKALGLQAGQNLIVTEPFYWDQTDATRTFAKRYFEKVHKMPNSNQASIYGAVMHYLKAIQAEGSTDTGKVMARMKTTPINDFMTQDGTIRSDGRVIRDMYLFRVKKPDESKGEWDIMEQVRRIPGKEAFKAPDAAVCALAQ
ncbi:ABC transporter substrate-binding protein [Advenella kashmirensis]